MTSSNAEDDAAIATATTTSTPPMSFAIRFKNGVRVYNAPNDSTGEASVALELESVNFVEIEYAADGSVLLAVDSDRGIHVIRDGAVQRVLPRPNVQAVAVSPRGAFALSWERFNKATNGDKDNLVVWSLTTGEVLASFTQKHFSKEQWPTLLWSDDEQLAARMVSSELQFYEAGDWSKVVSRVKLGDVTQFSFAPGGSSAKQLVATFTPEKGGKAANVRIFEYPRCDDAVNSKSFFSATEVVFKWNASGSHLLLTAHTEVDTTGQSYYGVDMLYFLSADGKVSETVQLKAEGSIHCVEWQPDGKRFGVVYGKMPSHSTLYNTLGQPVSDFGQAAHNTLVFAPNGRIAMLGGFGNLPGNMGLWDPRKLKLYGRASAHCSAVHSFSPNSRLLLTAVLSPRIRVDNGFKIFSYAGKLVCSVPIADLYDAAWRPALPGVYPIQRISAPLIDPADVAKLDAAASAASPSGESASTANAAAPMARGVYVPPALRNRQGGGGASAGTSAISAAMRAGAQSAPARHTVGANATAAKPRTAHELASAAESGQSGGGPVGDDGDDDVVMSAKQKKLQKLKDKKKQEAAAKKSQQQQKNEPTVAFVIEDPEF